MQDIWLTCQPQEFLDRFPAWYWLFYEVSELRVGRERVCAVLNIDQAFLDQCAQVPAAIHPKGDTFNLLDLIAIDAIAQARREKVLYEFINRPILDWAGLAWKALVGTVRARDIWIAAIPEKNSWYAPYFLAEGIDHPPNSVPINLGRSVRRVLLENKWPRISITVGESGHWDFHLDGCGHLLLEQLPPEGEVLQWPRRTEEPEWSSYRKLSAKNILEVDPIYQMTPLWSDNAEDLRARIGEEIDEVLAIDLDPRVPLDVRQMFEVMKGAVAYGFFYRPLTTFAASQIHFIEDAALHHRCQELGIKPPKLFHQRIAALLKAGVIPPYEAHIWEAKREIRNMVAHRTHQWLMWPGMDFGSVSRAAIDINRLFTPIFSENLPPLV